MLKGARFPCRLLLDLVVSEIPLQDGSHTMVGSAMQSDRARSLVSPRKENYRHYPGGSHWGLRHGLALPRADEHFLASITGVSTGLIRNFFGEPVKDEELRECLHSAEAGNLERGCASTRTIDKGHQIDEGKCRFHKESKLPGMRRRTYTQHYK